MAKQVFYGDEAREKVLAGAKTLADAVKTTMGPKGRNVVSPMMASPSLRRSTYRKMRIIWARRLAPS